MWRGGVGGTEDGGVGVDACWTANCGGLSSEVSTTLGCCDLRVVASADCSLIPYELIFRDTFNSSGRLAGGEVLPGPFLFSEGDEEVSDITFTSGEWSVSGRGDWRCGAQLGDVSCEALEDLVSLCIECSSSESSDSLSDLESNSSTSESSPNSSVSG